MDRNLNPPVGASTIDDIESYRSKTSITDPKTVFPQSVASGDPSPSGVILWTRISPDAYEVDKPLVVEVAGNADFTRNHRRRIIDSENITSEHDYTIKVDLDESNLNLEPDHRYYYRFEYDGVPSQIGRCKTLPEADATLESVRFAVITCQNYWHGYFGAYDRIAEENVDYLLDLGDFVYETSGENDYIDRDISLPDGIQLSNDVILASGLEDYREIYRTYLSDVCLQSALKRHTRIQSWDDHEFANDIYWDYENNCPRAPDHPYNESPEAMRRLVRDALKAWWEYTPARATYNPEADHLNEVLKRHRTFRFGTLVTLVVTDERLFKTKPPTSWLTPHVQNWVKDRIPDRITERVPGWARDSLPSWAKKRLQHWLPLGFFNKYPGRTMLGTTQRDWFIEEVRNSRTKWTVWTNEVLTLPLHIPKFNHDAWDGCYAERKRIMSVVKESLVEPSHDDRSNHGLENFVTLTGDMHSYLAGYQRVRFTIRDQITDVKDQIVAAIAPPEPESRPRSGRRVGVELMTPGVTSINIAETLAGSIEKRLGLSEGGVSRVTDGIGRILTWGVPTLIRHIEVFNSHEWGYSVVEFTPDGCTHRTYSVDKSTEPPNAESGTISEVSVPDRMSTGGVPTIIAEETTEDTHG